MICRTEYKERDSRLAKREDIKKVLIIGSGIGGQTGLNLAMQLKDKGVPATRP